MKSKFARLRKAVIQSRMGASFSPYNHTINEIQPILDSLGCSALDNYPRGGGLPDILLIETYASRQKRFAEMRKRRKRINRPWQLRRVEA